MGLRGEDDAGGGQMGVITASRHNQPSAGGYNHSTN